MRFAIFSSLISRSSTARSSLQGLLALSALVVLTGAKGQGCGPADEPPSPPDPDCGPGFHWETVCSPCEIGEMCEEQCVPDNVCPPGWGQQTFCGGSSTTITTTAGQGGMAGDVAMPVDPGECWTQCVPPQPFCPPGTIEQTVCGGGVTSTTVTVGSGGWTGSSSGVGGSGGWGTGGMMPMPPEECRTECVPVEPYCPPGTQPQTFCDGSTNIAVSSSSSVGVGGSGGSGGWAGAGDAGAWEGTGGTGGVGAPPPPPGCWTDCVPVEPYCPPGTQAQTVCGTAVAVSSSSVGVGGSGGSGGWADPGDAGAWEGTGGAGGSTTPPYPGDCWTDCVPVEPYCPPGTQAQTVCEGSSSVVGSTSAGGGYGGSGGSSGTGGCWTDCVPVEPYCPPDTIPQTVCGGSAVSVGSTGTGTGTGYGSDRPYPGDESCWTQCVPVKPYCPPGTQAQEVCYDGMPETTSTTGTGYGTSGTGGWGGCFFECLPVEPYCPPGTLEQQVCSGAGSTGSGMEDVAYPGECWTECLEGSVCPPESIERTICEQPAGGGSPPVCRTECVLMLP
ncbi:hypothetical protein WMF04_00515 [Sorangium sp. So ce260]|uniref:hypothetical protein n=1 Tax=Sorangium sp. So ce260 TaxID=3133291 RepID=UPI003F5FA973